jgi:uncharacterized protein YegP (UPF0339 family)
MDFRDPAYYRRSDMETHMHEETERKAEFRIKKAAHQDTLQDADTVEDAYYFVLVAANGEPVATSELYTSLNDAERGARDARAAAEEAEIVFEDPDAGS